MNGNLLLATDKGIWRTAWPPPEGVAACDPVTVDAPRESIQVIGAAGNFACAISENGRVFVWDGGAMMWRETPAWPRPELHPQVVLPIAETRLVVGTRPVGVWKLDERQGWRELGALGSVPAAARWAAPEGQPQPRVACLCDDGDGGLLVGVEAGGLWHWDGRVFRGVPLDDAHGAHPLHPTSVHAVSRNPGIEGGFLVSTSHGAYFLATAAGPAVPRQVAASAVVSALPEWRRQVPAPALAAAGRAVAGALWQQAAGVEFDGSHLLLATRTGELWRLPLHGPLPQGPWLRDLPHLHGLALLDEDAAADGLPLRSAAASD